MTEIKNTTVHLNSYYNQLLKDLANKREDKRAPIKTKQGIVEQLIERAHSRECRQ